MAVTATLLSQKWDSKNLWIEVKLVFTGSYTQGGDTVNLQGLGIQSTTAPLFMDVQSTAGTAGQAPLRYQWVPGTTQANGLLRAFSGAAEVATGAYPASILADTAYALFRSKGFR
jgi:hypothetical protein